MALSAFLPGFVRDAPGDEISSRLFPSTLSRRSLLEVELVEYLIPDPIDLLLPSSSSSSPSLEPSSSADEAFSPPEYPELSSLIFESSPLKFLGVCSSDVSIFRDEA